jgi:hypothetical protein
VAVCIPNRRHSLLIRTRWLLRIACRNRRLSLGCGWWRTSRSRRLRRLPVEVRRRRLRSGHGTTASKRSRILLALCRCRCRSRLCRLRSLVKVWMCAARSGSRRCLWDLLLLRIRHGRMCGHAMALRVIIMSLRLIWARWILVTLAWARDLSMAGMVRGKGIAG